MPKLNKYIQSKLSANNVGEICIYGEITDDKWYDEDVTLKEIKQQLDEMGNISQLDIRVNSYGGSVFAGVAISNVLLTYKMRKNVKIIAYNDGIMASMGSNIPMIADEIIMPENTLMMLHKPIMGMYGNANDFAKQIEVLNKVEESLITNYMRHFNGTTEELQDLLSVDTWLTAKEALAYGLCTSITDSVEMVASAKGINIGKVDFENKIADKIKAKYPYMKIKNESEGKKLFVYDEKLNEYGIDKKAFEDFNVSAEILISVFALVTDKTKVMTTLETAEPLVIEDNAKIEALTATLALSETKVKAYDKMVKETIAETLAVGIRAQGDKFNNELWEKTFKNFELQDIVAMKNDWQTQAETALNAGNRVSEPYSPKGKSTETAKAEDYNF